ncbi:MAG: hydroxyacid dehydrogenase [Phycisphaeraceae bacterium]|nr:hydroxyacid dehydrogenase [Phycisphaeraceae bacterium]
MPDQPLIILDPHPRRLDLIFRPEDRRRLESMGRVLWHEGERASTAHIDDHLPDAVAIVGQTDLPTERLDRASKLRVIMNVEGNFLPNIDYETCQQRGIHVLACAPAFAPAVAEMALLMALALARGIVEHDADFRQGNERYSAASNEGCFLLRGRTLGLLGCGNVGRALLPLLRPFGCSILVHDPWVHAHVLESMQTEPVDLDELMRRSEVLFLIAAVTTENRHLIGSRELALLPDGASVVLVGRSENTDFSALLAEANRGRIRAAIDVFPEEPVPADDPVRRASNVILSGHRAGGLQETYHEIGRMVADELELILAGLPPQRMQKAIPEVVARYRSKAIGT